MINKGKGCISAIFDGSIPIGIIKHGFDTVFQKKPNEPSQPEGGYVTNGLIAQFSGSDDYVGGSWVDRISGYKFTPIAGKTPAVYDATNKLYNQTTFGGMVSDFTIPVGSNFSFEVVTRDIKNATSPKISLQYATMVGGIMNGWDIGAGGIFLARTRTADNAVWFGSVGAGDIWGKYLTEFENNSLDTFTVVPNVGIFHNGVKVKDVGENQVEQLVGLFTHHTGSNAQHYRAIGKIHSVRLYNRQLTAEEVAQNYTEDTKIYGI